MKITFRLLATLCLLGLLILARRPSLSAQMEWESRLWKLRPNRETGKRCADDIKKYCTDSDPGEGRMVYCMQAHEDKISPKCAYSDWRRPRQLAVDRSELP